MAKYVGENSLSELVSKTKALVATKQNTLVSGTNIKTINNTSLLGSGDISTEVTTNKVTSLSSSSTDTQYPSAKCVYDLVGDVETLLTALNSGQGV